MAEIRNICREEVKVEIEGLRSEISKLRARFADLQPNGSNGERSKQDSGFDCCYYRPKMRPDGYSMLRPAKDTPRDEDKDEDDIVRDIQTVTVTVTDMDADVETHSQKFREILKNAKQEYDLACDVWGATTYVIVKDFADMAMGEIMLENVLRVTMVLLVLATNLFFQFMFLYWIGYLVMLPNIKAIQETYRSYHQVAWNGTHFRQQAFDDLGDEREKVCEMAISTALFMWACIFLWVARCMHEFRLIYRRKRSIDLLPDLPSGIAATHMVHELKVQIGDLLEEKKAMLVCMNRLTYLCVHILIFVPRIIISTCLLFMGTAFLTATESFSELILNSLALAFIFDIDELFFQCFLPDRIRKNLERTKIVSPSEEHLTHLSGKALDAADVKRVYLRSAVVLLITFSFVCIWFLVQPILPGYQFDVADKCSGYLEEGRLIPCKPWQKDCFPV